VNKRTGCGILQIKEKYSAACVCCGAYAEGVSIGFLN